VVAQIAAQVADALAAVHERGLVHRDLKPDNIFVGESDDGAPKATLLDFGIVKFLEDEQGVTKAGIAVGTPDYMSPEQIIKGGQLTHLSDIYALGMVMYTALTGKAAFASDTMANTLRGHCYEPVIPPSQKLDGAISPVLEAAVMKCLAKSPGDRFQSMAELRDALASEVPVTYSNAPLANATQNLGAARRGSTLKLLVPAIVIAAAAAAVLVVSSKGDEPAAVDSHAATTPPAQEVASASAVEPAETKPPPVAPAAPTIHLVLGSEPAGAVMLLGDERKELGPAPVEIDVPMSGEPLLLTARFADGDEVSEELIPDREPPPLVFKKPKLQTAKPKGTKTKRGDKKSDTSAESSDKKKPVDREGTFNPFE
jgi:serine/threonine-protein kinase